MQKSSRENHLLTVSKSYDHIIFQIVHHAIKHFELPCLLLLPIGITSSDDILVGIWERIYRVIFSLKQKNLDKNTDIVVLTIYTGHKSYFFLYFDYIIYTQHELKTTLSIYLLKFSQL